MKEAERRQTQGTDRRILRCGARPFGARTLDGVPPRLSSRGVFHPQGQLQARLPGTRSARALPAFACPSPGMHLPPRSSCRGTDTQAAREQAANPPAGTALAPMTRCASAPCPSKERGLWCNYNGDICQEKSDTRSPDGAKRNPGTRYPAAPLPRITLRSIRATTDAWSYIVEILCPAARSSLRRRLPIGEPGR